MVPGSFGESGTLYTYCWQQLKMSPPVLSEAQKHCVDVVVNKIQTQTHKTHKGKPGSNMSNIQKIPKQKYKQQKLDGATPTETKEKYKN